MSIRATSTPILLTAVVGLLRDVDGVIWDSTRQDAGTLLRVAIGKKNVRILVPALGNKALSELPQEKGSPIHVVYNLTDLRLWLSSIKKPDSQLPQA